MKKVGPKNSSNYFIAAKVTGFLALITLPSAPLIAPLFCSKSITGYGCDLSDIGMGIYFIFAAVVLGLVSLVLFTLSSDSKKNNY
jgi:hypothetical protein